MASLEISAPLQPSNARKIILDLFIQKSQWTRSDLADEVLKIHKNAGGSDGTQAPSTIVKKCLSVLRQEGRVQPIAKGVWARLDPSTQIDSSANVQILSTSLETETSEDEALDFEEGDDLLSTSEKVTMGQGPEAVYLYFNPNDRELAKLRGLDHWECKIGRTSQLPVNSRIFSQGIKTSLSKMPVIGLVILTDNCVLTERAIHSALRHVGVEAPESPGTEWFLTNPKRIASWYEAYSKNLSILINNDPFPKNENFEN